MPARPQRGFRSGARSAGCCQIGHVVASLQALGPLRGTDADPFEGAKVDANALGWALAVVTSRAFRTRGPGQVRRRPLPAELVGTGEGGAPMSLRWTL